MAELGKDTSEYAVVQDVMRWIKIGAGALVVAIPVIMGVVPKGHDGWLAALMVVGAVSAALAGKTFLGKSYVQGRSAIKAAKAMTEKP